MKHFVKWSSLIILVVLSIVNLIELGGVIFDIVLSVTRLKEATPSYMDGSEMPIFDNLLTGITALVIAVLCVLALIIIAEIVINIIISVKAAKEKAYKHYKTFSIFSILELIANTFAWLLIIGLMGGTSHEFQQSLTEIVLVLFCAKVLILFWLILDLLGAHQCVKDGL